MFFNDNKCTLFFVLFIWNIILTFLYFQSRSSKMIEGMSDGKNACCSATSINQEALQNIASIYNKKHLIVDNLTVTGKVKCKNLETTDHMKCNDLIQCKRLDITNKEGIGWTHFNYNNEGKNHIRGPPGKTAFFTDVKFNENVTCKKNLNTNHLTCKNLNTDDKIISMRRVSKKIKDIENEL